MLLVMYDSNSQNARDDAMKTKGALSPISPMSPIFSDSECESKEETESDHDNAVTESIAPDVDATSEPKADPEPDAETHSAASPEMETESEITAVPEPEPDPVHQLVSDSEPDPEVDPKAVAESVPKLHDDATEPESEADPLELNSPAAHDVATENVESVETTNDGIIDIDTPSTQIGTDCDNDTVPKLEGVTESETLENLWGESVAEKEDVASSLCLEFR